MSVTASVTDGGTLSYQWYSNTTNSNTGGTAVGSNSNTYTPPTTTVGTLYYYVVVTNTNNSVNGAQTATTASSTAAVTVNAPFVPVDNIADVPLTASSGIPLTLTGTVVPANATNKTVVWEVRSAGTTGATITGNTLNTTAAGAVIVRAAIANGIGEGRHYGQDFYITVNSITGNSEISPADPLKAWMQDGLLHVSGLTQGEMLYIYNMYGQLVVQETAVGEEAKIILPARGVYIVISDGKTVKVVY